MKNIEETPLIDLLHEIDKIEKRNKYEFTKILFCIL